jgi:NADP-dependent 3-hydroxy acid dehydrogenase YdfG
MVEKSTGRSAPRLHTMTIAAATASNTGDRKVAVVTGASSGIGEATARVLAAQGYHVVVGARRVDRLHKLADEIDGTAIPLDVTDEESVQNFCAQIPAVDVLINNAGGAKGLASVAEADLDDWRWMWETNVLGTLRVTKALLPKLIDSGDGLIVTISSIAAIEAYDNGSGYTTAKHAQAVLHRTLRPELLGKPVRLTEIQPGMVETEFSLVRFDGDAEKADKVYEGLTPLTADDVAEVIGFVASRPPHVNLDTILLMPRDQASARRNIKTG